ncbi:MAG: hypothetical protein NZU63_09880 [Gemmataceae bacterium]|nr:hypothetical protein [Gemmataceae bacterium]MDW8243374.1 hypothetical protein [Thermogemmata sp.]
MSYSPEEYESASRREDNAAGWRLEEAQAAVSAPAMLLILIGTLSLIGEVVALIQLPQVPARLQEAIDDIQQDNTMPQEQKELWIDVLTSLKEWMKNPINYVLHGIAIVLIILIIIGGIQMMKLSGLALPVTASILSMIPFITSCCCVIGLPVGIWSLIVLARPDVKAAIAQKRSGNPSSPA